MDAARIMVVEDDADIGRLLQYNLRQAGFDVQHVTSAPAALAACAAAPPHVVVLDLMLGDDDGLEVCRALRAAPATSGVGVLMVTALGDDDHRIAGLEVGADDYVVKPFVVREVVLRVKALAARVSSATPPATDAVVQLGPITVDHRAHEARIGSRVLALRPLEYRLLAVLVGAPGKAFTRAELLTQVWGLPGDLSTRTVDVHVRRLRMALGDAAAPWIETVSGSGYRARAEPT